MLRIYVRRELIGTRGAPDTPLSLLPPPGAYGQRRWAVGKHPSKEDAPCPLPVRIAEKERRGLERRKPGEICRVGRGFPEGQQEGGASGCESGGHIAVVGLSQVQVLETRVQSEDPGFLWISDTQQKL